ncbi:BrnA antitoxin family protein [Sphingomonas sp.]|uniref:BrnA antitoxin family protein n=1 Tax=Sphingomonas sp. TaxID=28214 RepID=UPI002DD63427|nr:BrnA antitoxin family protein [Sphingomonas sp.]
MTENTPNTGGAWLDPADDAPELTDEMLDIAEFSIGGKVIRPATGYLGPNGVVRGRPPMRGRAKQQVTLRLDPDVIAKFREDGPGWQGRINEALRKAVGLAG